MGKQQIIIQFDTTDYKNELSIIIGNETLTLNNFVEDSTEKIYQCVVSSYAEERIIKKLVENMSLK